MNKSLTGLKWFASGEPLACSQADVRTANLSGDAPKECRWSFPLQLLFLLWFLAILFIVVLRLSRSESKHPQRLAEPGRLQRPRFFAPCLPRFFSFPFSFFVPWKPLKGPRRKSKTGRGFGCRRTAKSPRDLRPSKAPRRRCASSAGPLVLERGTDRGHGLGTLVLAMCLRGCSLLFFLLFLCVLLPFF